MHYAIHLSDSQLLLTINKLQIELYNISCHHTQTTNNSLIANNLSAFKINYMANSMWTADHHIISVCLTSFSKTLGGDMELPHLP